MILISQKQLLHACTIIDRIRMRTMLPMDEQITSKEIETFFNEVGYVTEIDRAANRRTNKPAQSGHEAVILDV